MKNNSNIRETKVVSVRLPKILYVKLTEYAKKKGCLNESEAIRAILRDYLSQEVEEVV